jgi:hypothetical protein
VREQGREGGEACGGGEGGRGARSSNPQRRLQPFPPHLLRLRVGHAASLPFSPRRKISRRPPLVRPPLRREPRRFRLDLPTSQSNLFLRHSETTAVPTNQLVRNQGSLVRLRTERTPRRGEGGRPRKERGRIGWRGIDRREDRESEKANGRRRRG